MDVLSLESNLTEVSYLRREYGLNWRTVAKADLPRIALQRAHIGEPVVLGVSNPTLYFEPLSELPSQSVLLLMLSDEDFSHDRLQLARSRSVRHVFRNYSPVGVQGEVVRSITSAVQDGIRYPSFAPRLALEAVRGRKMRRRRNIGHEGLQSYSTVPLGYTEPFERGFVAANNHETIASDQSLFDFAVPPDSERRTRVGFIGATGQVQRKLALRVARSVKGSSIDTTPGTWGGHVNAPVEHGRSYVAMLQDSEFALCPPGFCNIESFRTTEALICGSLPVSVDTALSHGGGSREMEGTTLFVPRWAALGPAIASTGDRERCDRVLHGITVTRQRIAQVRADLERLTLRP